MGAVQKRTGTTSRTVILDLKLKDCRLWAWDTKKSFLFKTNKISKCYTSRNCGRSMSKKKQ